MPKYHDKSAMEYTAMAPVIHQNNRGLRRFFSCMILSSIPSGRRLDLKASLSFRKSSICLSLFSMALSFQFIFKPSAGLNQLALAGVFVNPEGTGNFRMRSPFDGVHVQHQPKTRWHLFNVLQ